MFTIAGKSLETPNKTNSQQLKSLGPQKELPLFNLAAHSFQKGQSEQAFNVIQGVESKSKISRSKTVSLKMSKIRRQSQKLATAQWRLKQLEAKQRVMDEQHRLETEMREKQYKTEIARLELKKEVMEAEAEVDKCDLESQYSDVDDDEDLNQRLQKSLEVESQTLHQKMEKFFNSELRWSVETLADKDPIIGGVNQDVKRSQVVGERREISREKDMQGRGDSGDNRKSELHLLLEGQTILMERQQASAEKFATGMELPKREFIYFDGNPANYTRFIRNFEMNVENRVLDMSVKLLYLIQYTLGVTREAIENCVILPAKEVYAKAKEILRKKFGQKHKIVCALTERVIKSQQIKPGESDKLMQLARDMRNCLLNSTQMNYRSDINSMETLSKVVKKLPLYLQAKWAERSGSLIKDDIEPEFEHLTEFIEKNASVSNTMFGKLVGSKPGDDTKTKVKPRIPNNGILFTTKAEGTKKDTLQDIVGTPSDDGSIPQKKEIRFVYCDQINHELGRCYKFRAKSNRERLDFVRKEKLCDNCLRRNHLARRCRFNAACMVSGCSGKHHSLLHPNVSQKKPQPGLEDKSKEESSQDGSEAAITGNCSTSINSRWKVYLRIVPVKVSNEEGTREIQTYAFIDNGSDTTLCTTELVDELNLPIEPCEFSLTTINGKIKTRSGQEVKMNVRNINGDGDIHLDRVWTVESLPISEKDIPTAEEINHWSHLSDIELPRLENGKVLILIGSDAPEAHWIFEDAENRKNH